MQTMTSEQLPFALGKGNMRALTQSDETFDLLTWDDLEDAISSKDIASIPRKPSVLRKYMAWTRIIKSQYGSVTEFVLRNKLHWDPLPNRSDGRYLFETSGKGAFAHPADYKILRNDWPYAVEQGIVHLVVWSKIRLPSMDDGSLTQSSKDLVEEFIRAKFIEPATGSEGRVLWFRNEANFQTVGAIEHIHVMVKADEVKVQEWTGQKQADIEAENFSNGGANGYDRTGENA